MHVGGMKNGQKLKDNKNSGKIRVKIAQILMVLFVWSISPGWSGEMAKEVSLLFSL
jgi:hypothetical protein